MRRRKLCSALEHLRTCGGEGLGLKPTDKWVALTTSPVLQFQIIKTSRVVVTTEIINLEAVIAAHGTYTCSSTRSVTHNMSLFCGRWWGVPSLMSRRRIRKEL